MTDLDSLQDEIIVSRIYSALNQYRYAQQRINADTARINPTASGSTIYVNLQSDNANSPIRKLAITATDLFEGDAKQDTGIGIDKIDIVRDNDLIKTGTESNNEDDDASEQGSDTWRSISPAKSSCKSVFLASPENIALSFAKIAASELSVSEIDLLL